MTDLLVKRDKFYFYLQQSLCCFAFSLTACLFSKPLSSQQSRAQTRPRPPRLVWENDANGTSLLRYSLISMYAQRPQLLASRAVRSGYRVQRIGRTNNPFEKKNPTPSVISPLQMFTNERPRPQKNKGNR